MSEELKPGKIQVMPEEEVRRPVLAAISAVMGEVGSVKKEGFNEFHRYNYATAADVMHALQPLLAKHGLTIVQHQKEIQFIQDGAAMAIPYEFHLYHSSGDKLDLVPIHTGVAAAKTKNGAPDDKAANKCHTAARKYFLLSLFQIPTGDYADPDADGDVPAGKNPANREVQKELDRTKKAPEKSAGPVYNLEDDAGIIYPFSACDAFLDTLGRLLKDAHDPIDIWTRNEKTIESIRYVAEQAKNDKLVGRVDAAYKFANTKAAELNP